MPESIWSVAALDVNADGRRDLVAMGRDAVADWSQRWRLVNLVDARNTVAVRWLRRVGFDVGAGPGLVTFRLGARV